MPIPRPTSDWITHLSYIYEVFKHLTMQLGGPPHSSRQEFLCLSGNIPKRIGKEKHEKTTVDLPIFDNASFCPASPPICPLPILEYCQPAKKIGDHHRTYFWKVRTVTIANFWFCWLCVWISERKFFCGQFYVLIIIMHLIHLSSCLFPRTEYLTILVEQRADVSLGLCSCIDQVKDKPSKWGVVWRWGVVDFN